MKTCRYSFLLFPLKNEGDEDDRCLVLVLSIPLLFRVYVRCYESFIFPEQSLVPRLLTHVGLSFLHCTVCTVCAQARQVCASIVDRKSHPRVFSHWIDQGISQVTVYLICICTSIQPPRS